VSFRQKATRRVDRDAAGERGLALERRDAALALVEEAEIFDVEDLGDGEAVVHFGAVDLARLDARHPVCPLARDGRGLETGEALLLVQVRMIRGDTEAGDV